MVCILTVICSGTHYCAYGSCSPAVGVGAPHSAGPCTLSPLRLFAVVGHDVLCAAVLHRCLGRRALLRRSRRTSRVLFLRILPFAPALLSGCTWPTSCRRQQSRGRIVRAALCPPSASSTGFRPLASGDDAQIPDHAQQHRPDPEASGEPEAPVAKVRSRKKRTRKRATRRSVGRCPYTSSRSLAVVQPSCCDRTNSSKVSDPLTPTPQFEDSA